MRVTILASGSSGNAALIEAGGTRILVDAGVGPRTLARKLREANIAAPPDAIVITHGHADHVGQCGRLSKGLRIPVYASESTARTAHLGDRCRVRVFGARAAFAVGDITVSPHPIPHDAAQVSLVFTHGDRSIGLATDLGEVPPRLLDHLAVCDVLLIESNHDPEMLAKGPYPAYLKQRIASARGHLSNQQTHALLRALSPRTHTVVLMHLSETNNLPHIALDVARDALSGRTVKLFAAMRDDARTFDATDDAHHTASPIATDSTRRPEPQLSFAFGEA